MFYILCLENTQADFLSQLATFDCGKLKKIFIEHLENPSIDSEEEVHQIQVGHEPSWIDLIVKFLTSGTLLTDPTKAYRIKRLTAQYVITDDQFFLKIDVFAPAQVSSIFRSQLCSSKGAQRHL